MLKIWKFITAFLRASGLTGLWFVTVLLLLVTVASFLGKYNFICETLSNFRILLALASVAMLLLLVSAGRLKMAGLCTVVLLSNLIEIVPYYIPPSRASNAGGTRLTILHMNLWGGRNKKYELVREVIANYNPDIVAISEVTPAWQKQIETALPKDFVYGKCELRYGGIAVYSRVPLNDTGVDYLGKINRPHITTTVLANNQPVELVVAHSMVPFRQHPLRNEEFKVLAHKARDSKAPFVVVGDLNCGPWSPHFKGMLKRGHLRDSQMGFGLQPSWSPFHNIPMIPIDHCLYSNGIEVVRRELGPYVGSDHLPIFVELNVPAKTL